MKNEPMGNIRYALQWIVDDAVARTPKDGVWVEIGAGTGRGISYMARTLIDAGRDDVTLYSVDPFAGTARNGEQQASGPPTWHGDWTLFLDNMQARAPEELRRIHIMRVPSILAARAFFDNDSVSLLIVDGNHSFAGVSGDVYAWRYLIPPGGVIGFDDMVAGSDVERYVMHEFPRCERRGNPNSEGGQADWPTARVIL